MSGEGEYDLVLTAPAHRALTDRLPEAVFAQLHLANEPQRNRPLAVM